ncbi:hypothetical protein BU23DRAFT_558636 [Bimuria novae-zelandiae CBS 107.79]|uniref:Uncharacterized protein n=1 Tax=Bimuria novae-zelandiae CBS 107.79 TaxID=1447943 RepID=A0A6A5UT93_9PLEO|nr:hypothetical protein BU23DRAFT_558636 [Bimuria novae-zelandiae CBS 107.79]
MRSFEALFDPPCLFVRSIQNTRKRRSDRLFGSNVLFVGSAVPKTRFTFSNAQFQDSILGEDLSKSVRYSYLYLRGTQVTVQWSPEVRTFTVAGKYGI